MADNISPFPYSFCFSVNFSRISNKKDSAFKEVSGIEMHRNTTSIKEGGENRFSYKLPETTSYENLILKRGMIVKSTSFSNWVRESIQSDFSKPVKPKDIWVTLFDKSFTALKVWQFYNAYPVKWSVSNLNAQENSIVIESLEFAYNYFSAIDKLPGKLNLQESK